MKVNDDKVLAVAYLILEALNRKELQKLILLLIGAYFEEGNNESKHDKSKKRDQEHERTSE